MGLFKNFGKPEGLTGKLLLSGMNLSHTALSRWALEHVDLEPNDRVLDVGCGGGKNLRRMLRLCPRGQVDGIDISVECVRKSLQSCGTNRNCEVLLASVEQIPYPEDSFDTVTSFESHYFFPCMESSLREILRVLRPGGTFMTACCYSDPECIWGHLVKDMRICTPAKLEEYLIQAGFTDIRVDTSHRAWACVTGKKPSRKAAAA